MESPLCSSPLDFTHLTISIKCSKFQQLNGEESNQFGCSKNVKNDKKPRICLNFSYLECGKVISLFLLRIPCFSAQLPTYVKWHAYHANLGQLYQISQKGSKFPLVWFCFIDWKTSLWHWHIKIKKTAELVKRDIPYLTSFHETMYTGTNTRVLRFRRRSKWGFPCNLILTPLPVRDCLLRRGSDLQSARRTWTSW